MTSVFNDPRDFREEMIEGYVAAYARHVRRVPGASGILAVDAPAPGRVSVVVGGGSGHYPAFYGLVGRGVASAAAIGDVFTSPSGEQAYRVARAVDGGAGVLFTFGNYSGDVLNFAMAETRLAAEGTPCATVLVTDDVLSAPPAEADKRRGIAGGLYVFKTAGASAARGDDLATVEALTRRANGLVRTVGVGFDGCTLPGQAEPLFTVAPGRMEVGLGIHGEPGIRTQDRLPAAELARLMVDALVAEAPPGAGARAAVLVNGLGATKYEELFVLYAGIAPLLAAAGVEAYAPRIGEFVTSLDMAGCSLTLFWLDDDLLSLHDATAETPAFVHIGPDGRPAVTGSASSGSASTGTVASGTVTTATGAPTTPTSNVTTTGASATSTEPAGPVTGRGRPGPAGAAARAAVLAALRAVEAHEEELGRLDAAMGDGDHGSGMVRGFTAAVAALAGHEGTARDALAAAGGGFMDAAGGASGALVGSWLTALGAALPADDDAVDVAGWSAAFTAGAATVQRLGDCRPGDKTMLDTLDPFARAFAQAAVDVADQAQAWSSALAAAEAGMRSTADMVSRKGRAARLGERSRGHQDAGATSMLYVLQAMAALSDPSPADSPGGTGRPVGEPF